MTLRILNAVERAIELGIAWGDELYLDPSGIGQVALQMKEANGDQAARFCPAVVGLSTPA
jgi:hypothetical protein